MNAFILEPPAVSKTVPYAYAMPHESGGSE